jgi:hypothetical protein
MRIKNGKRNRLEKGLFVTVAIVLGLCGSLTQAAILLERPLDTVPEEGRFSNFFVDSTGQRIANSFTVEADATVTDLHWWGYFINTASDINNDFRIRFYSANPTTPTTPGTLVYENIFKPTLADTGLISPIVSTTVWEFSADPIPELSLIANETYWLEIAYLPSISLNQWLWSRATTSDGQVVSTGSITDVDAVWSQWGQFDRDSAFYLTGTFVPVPAAMWLFGSGLLGLMGIARKQRNR